MAEGRGRVRPDMDDDDISDARERGTLAGSRDYGYQQTRDEAASESNEYTSTRDAEDLGFASRAWATNLKRTYDVYQDLDVDRARRSNDHYARLQTLAETALANAVGISNRVNNNGAGYDHAINRAQLREESLFADLEADSAGVNDVAEGGMQNEILRTASLDDVALKLAGLAETQIALTSTLADSIAALAAAVATIKKA